MLPILALAAGVAAKTGLGVVVVGATSKVVTTLTGGTVAGTGGYVAKKVYDESSPERIAAKKDRLNDKADKADVKAAKRTEAAGKAAEATRKSTDRHIERLEKKSAKLEEKAAEKKQKAFNKEMKKAAATIAKLGEKNGLGNVISNLVGLATGQKQNAEAKGPEDPKGPTAKESFFGFVKELKEAVTS